MTLTPQQLEFVRTNTSSAMITTAGDVAKAVRISHAVLDGRILSSGTTARVRTRRLRADPRCTLFVFDPQWQWLTMETVVAIREGDDALQDSVRMFRQMQNKPTGPLSWFGGEQEEAAFVELLRNEGRLLYEFEVERVYGMA